ncbi:MAG: RagB/SusD family nutrient uptake outer membrane protein [Gemmatimonadales bacterium]
MTRHRILKTVGLGALVYAAGCSDSLYDIQNTNAPTVEQLTGSPNRAILARAALGIAAQASNDLGGEITFYAIFGREGYNLNGNDPRLTQEMIRGPLEAGGFGGANFGGKYISIRTINSYLAAVDNAADLTAAEKSGSKGYAKTIEALHLFRVILRNGALGAPVDVQGGLDEEPAPFLSQANVYARIVTLLDEARSDLAAGGAAFPFSTPPGFEIAGTPADFIKFNRALLAKVQVHRATLAGGGNAAYQGALAALAESFVSTTASMATGVYYSFGAAAGEPNNPISEGLSTLRYFVHPSYRADAQLKTGGARDDRFTSKVQPFPDGSRTVGNLTGSDKPVMFNTPGTYAADLGADIGIIRNEELLLLRAEANWFAGSKASALSDLNLVRTTAGGLPASTLTTASTDDQFVTALIYERRYSLMWESGTRWIDARRFGKKSTLPVDRSGDVVFDNMLVPGSECDARKLTVPCTPPTQ